jgi:hypothetical protein
MATELLVKDRPIHRLVSLTKEEAVKTITNLIELLAHGGGGISDVLVHPENGKDPAYRLALMISRPIEKPPIKKAALKAASKWADAPWITPGITKAKPKKKTIKKRR